MGWAATMSSGAVRPMSRVIYKNTARPSVASDAAERDTSTTRVSLTVRSQWPTKTHDHMSASAGLPRGRTDALVRAA